MPKLTWTFRVCVPLGVLLLVPALWIIVWGVRMRTAFHRERVTPLTTVECDLSKAGTIEFPVRVDYSRGHGFRLLMEFKERPPGREEEHAWLYGLTGVARVKTGPFDHDYPSPVDGSFSAPPLRANSYFIAKVTGSPPGDYVLSFDVVTGASALENVPHRLVVMNDVCGCEMVGVFVGHVIGVGGSLIGVCLLVAGFTSRTNAASDARANASSEPEA